MFGKHVISYPISPTSINILVFDTVPGGLGKPLPGSSVSKASKEDIKDLYIGWEDDVREAIDVNSTLRSDTYGWP